MRPDAGLIQALRVPLALNLQALRALLAQNQLKLAAMADMEARHDAGAGRGVACCAGARPAASVCSLGLVAAGGLGRHRAAWRSGAGELAMLGLLALLAVAGVFLIFGLLSGYLRLSERVAEAELVKTIADGLDSGAQDRRPAGHRALPQSGPAAPDRQARRPARDARGAVRGRAEFGAGLLPPQPRGRARRGRATRSSTSARAWPADAAGAGCGSPCGPFLAPRARRGSAAADALAGRRRHARAHPRDRDRERARSRRSPSTTACRRACSPWRRTGASPISTPRCRNGCGLRPESGTRADAARHRVRPTAPR